MLLKPVNKNIALLFLLLNLGGVAIQCFSDLFLFASQLLLSGADYLKAFQADQLPALAMLSLYLNKNGFMIAQIFYGAWLFPLGYLVFKSGFLPRILGIVLMVHCAFWLMTALQFFLFPGFGAITYVSWPLGFIAEFGLDFVASDYGRQRAETSFECVRRSVIATKDEPHENDGRHNLRTAEVFSRERPT